jgi:hypothetical protein
VNTWETIASKMGSYEDLYFALDPGAGLYVGLSGVLDDWSSGVTMSQASWQHVAVTYDGSDVRVYRNGVNGNSQPATGTLALGTNTDPLNIGMNTTWNEFLDGQLDEVRISNIARSSNWIATEFSNQDSPSTFFKPLGSEETQSISPAGKLMDTIVGSGAATLTFDTVSQDAYWYTDLSYPTGQDDASIAAGSYTANLYFDSLPAGSGDWFDAAWDYRKSITIDHTKVAATLSGFPVLVNLTTDSDLAARARDDGWDIVFASADGTVQYSHEI